MYTNTFGASTKGGKLREKNFDIMRFFILYMPSTILIFFGHKKKRIFAMIASLSGAQVYLYMFT